MSLETPGRQKDIPNVSVANSVTVISGFQLSDKGGVH